ncbi:precorrin-6A/cobalt-precorrin-6A reductase [Aliikangiella sp. IMCC44359]|uniref:precorrin-6A/cobalt-precorrin-6A reductase n=1 Tax=Aliikangiella sp. IMCC44359 TaxID=3459125 RepID=UPI00403B34D9
MSILLLGGTADARKMACHLFEKGLTTIYSVAGLVRQPNVPCEIVSGGFSQFGGLVEYIQYKNVELEKNQQKKISLILDATHPYAVKMSCAAVRSAVELDIPCWRFERQPWKPGAQDDWFTFNNWDELLPNIIDKKCVFFSVGQIEQKLIENLMKLLEDKKLVQKQILRTAIKSNIEIPDSMHWIKAIGPFEKAKELALMKAFNVDVLLTKNSGGSSTIAKLQAARELAIPVMMLARPELAKADKVFDEINECENSVINFFLK